MEPIKPVFFIEGQTHPDQHRQNTVKLLLGSALPTEGVEVDIQSANSGAGQSNEILRYAVTATSGPPSFRN